LKDFSVIARQLPIESTDKGDLYDKGEDIFNVFFGRFPTLLEVEEYMINRAMKLADGRLSVAAALLGISRQGLYKRVK
jgi:transcriptional regulator of acetoin/glycerol metabolism